MTDSSSVEVLQAESKLAFNVLLIDDQPLVGEQVRRLLAPEADIGFHYCRNPIRAIAAALESDPSVILLDLTMPNMDGLTLLKTFQADEQLHDIPVIVLSSKEEVKTKADAFGLGASDYLVKLPDATELVARIRRHSLGYIHLRAQRRTEQALRRAEAESREAAGEAQRANRAKSVFLANMSHGLRTPLNAILGHSRLLLENEAELSTSQLQALRHVEDGGRELLKLIDNILSVTRIESGQQFLEPTEFDVGDLLRQLEATFNVRCEHKGLSWRAEIALDETRVRGDGRKLQQALVHLLDNAVKFTEAGEVRLQVTSRDDLYSFEVSDTGPGIPAARRAAVFELFNQGEEGLEKGGSGLGLTIARSHVALMGGTFTLEDGENGGVVASFAVPLPKTLTGSQSPGSQTRARPKGLAPGSALRARLVGRSDNLEIMTQILERIGSEVAHVEELGEKEMNESSDDWDVIIIDIDTYNLDATRALGKSYTSRPKLVGLSGSSLLGRRYLDAGFDRCIEVPLRPGRVYAELAELLGIEYEYDAVETRAPASTDEFNLKLPAELRDKLSKAAATHSITELKRHIGELESLGPEEQRLADHLSTLGRGFDMAAIAAVLREINTQ